MIFQRFGRIARIDTVPAGASSQFTKSDRHATRRDQRGQSVRDLTDADITCFLNSPLNPDAGSVDTFRSACAARNAIGLGESR